MTVTLTYDSVLSRVQIAATGMPATADNAHFERSIDGGINWTTVRGGDAVSIVAGAASLDDYEFTDEVLNTYRVSAVDTSPISYVAAGATATGNNVSVVPAMPAGWAAGDLLLILASIRNSGTGTVNVPAGWTSVVDFDNVRILGRRAVTGDTSPTVTFANGAAGADTFGQMAAFRNAELVPITSNTVLNGITQNIATPAINLSADGSAVIIAGWKQDDWTSISVLAGMTEIGRLVSIVGSDAGQVWDYVIQTTAANVPVNAFVVTGGATAISRGITVAFEPAEFVTQESASITPSLADDCGPAAVWIKSIPRPFLNRRVSIIQQSDTSIARQSRSGVFDIVGRSFPVAITDVRSGRYWTMFVRTFTQQETEDFDLILASGDPLFVQPPAACSIPGGYVAVGDTIQSWHPLRPALCTWTLPCVEVAPPGSAVVGATITWAGILAQYATWADLMSAKATWADVLTSIGSPSDVLVP